MTSDHFGGHNAGNTSSIDCTATDRNGRTVSLASCGEVDTRWAKTLSRRAGTWILCEELRRVIGAIRVYPCKCHSSSIRKHTAPYQVAINSCRDLIAWPTGDPPVAAGNTSIPHCETSLAASLGQWPLARLSQHRITPLLRRNSRSSHSVTRVLSESLPSNRLLLAAFPSSLGEVRNMEERRSKLRTSRFVAA